ncbi:MAG: hypothetical protein EZS28_050675 [Streblomastix strix]|uniref:Uncharacterized protein n=1 Tax=Streblomastix strix TaxID=222440 RepID=A0A5J4T6J6_9EUKA|nr:MAG: hypothetical protein EZS28_050675 [Streblomastix strix]
MSQCQSISIIPAIVEVETKKPDPSVCRRLLDVISEDEYMIKESAHFIISEHQLIIVIAYTLDVVENQVVLNTEDEGCC